MKKRTSASLDRREFLASTCALAAGAALGDRQVLAAGDEKFVKEAMFYKKLPEDRVECGICPKRCVVPDMERGVCGVRENREGKYYTLVHSRPVSLRPDPIEKKPFFHYKPGTLAFSIATVGCNLDCKYCQNWSISQKAPEDVRAVYLPPEQVVAQARKYKCASIAYTYSEPTVFYEYMYDTASAGKKNGVPSVVISNGYMRAEPMKKLCTVVDAIKIDFKSYSNDFYRKVCKGTLKPVLDTLQFLAKSKTWYEIVVLIVPTLNDGKEDIENMCKWIHDKLGPHVPVHFSRFHPTYKLQNLPPTPIRTLERCYKTALDAGLKYAYLGNVPGHRAESTYCHKCGKNVVTRIGYAIRGTALNKGKCRGCGTAIPGIWE
jgi:pyruvate formate lyase activating enzyme